MGRKLRKLAQGAADPQEEFVRLVADLQNIILASSIGAQRGALGLRPN